MPQAIHNAQAQIASDLQRATMMLCFFNLRRVDSWGYFSMAATKKEEL
jgi:hypothetical protein